MSGSGFAVGPIAIIIGIFAYILKRWWDNADAITQERRRVYSNYFSTCYDLVLKALEENDRGSDRPLAEQYCALHKHTPEFLLHASPTAVIISDVFFKRCLPFVFNDAGERGGEKYLELAAELQESLNLLREVLKSELYPASPRFQIERWRYKQKARRLAKEG